MGPHFWSIFLKLCQDVSLEDISFKYDHGLDGMKKHLGFFRFLRLSSDLREILFTL